MADLKGKSVAVLVETGFEQVEMTEPIDALRKAGAQVVLVSPQRGRVRGWNSTDWGDEFEVDVALSEARPEKFEALVLPGGVMNPDKLRMNEDAVKFVKSFVEEGKPIAAICHGPQILINADAVNGRNVTSYWSLKKDLENAGANWVDQEVVVDNGLVTSRSPKDIPAFNSKMIEEFMEGRHEVTKSPHISDKPVYK